MAGVTAALNEYEACTEEKKLDLPFLLPMRAIISVMGVCCIRKLQ